MTWQQSEPREAATLEWVLQHALTIHRTFEHSPTRQSGKGKMAEAVEIAIRELKYTYAEAIAYLAADDKIPEILRSHANDLAEDAMTLTQLKNSYADRTKEVLDLLAEAKRAKRTAEKEAYAIEVELKKQQMQPKQVDPVPIVPGKACGVKLPKIQLPIFDGESCEDYRGFMEAFLETISAEPDMSDIRKWMFLKSQLAGKALQMVNNLPLAPETYQAGVTILEDAYGSSRRAVLRLYQRLQTLPNAEMETESLKVTTAKMEGILLSLKHLNVDPNKDDFLRSVVISKFPDEILHTLKISDEMSLDQFREELSKYNKVRDCVIQQVVTVTASKKGNAASGSNSKNISSETNGSNGEAGQSTGSNGQRGRAWGTKPKPQHSKSALSTNGGDAQKSTPSGQVTDSNSNPSNKKERQRLHKCIFCSGEHWSDDCTQVKSIDERIKLVADRCQKCFRKAHEGTSCERWSQCAYCKETTHNRAICPKTFNATGRILLAKAEESKGEVSVTNFITAIIPVGSIKSESKSQARALIDTAATRSLITSDLVDKLKLVVDKTKRVRLSGLKETSLAEDVQTTELMLLPRNEKPIRVQLCIVPSIVDDARSVDVAEIKRQYPSCREIPMPEDGNGQKVQLLLGYDSLVKIVTLQSSKQIGQLQLMSTKFGWIPFGDPVETINQETMSSICLLKEIDPIKLMCDLDQIGLTDFLRTDNEEQEITLEKFHKSIKRIGKNYQIEWPYRYDPPDLEDNFGLAMGRLTSLYKQLAPSPDLLKAYDQIIQEQLETDVIEPVNTRKKLPRGRVHYLPHRAVIRIGKSTPIRMVFDAAAKCRRGAKSLNDNIYKGGNWVTDIPSILLRFRRYETVFTSDIRRAFHQILIAPNDRDVTRFLWLRDVNKPPTPENVVVYRFKRMAFGIIASPYLLSATIKYHVKENSSEYAEQLETDLYADNLVVSLPTTIEPYEFYKSIKNTFEDMGMNITQWCTEDDDLLRKLRSDDILHENMQTVLGIPWNRKNKTLAIKDPQITSTSQGVITKRTALKEMAKIYDPLGWAIPVVLLARTFLRRVWLKDYSWDQPFDREFTEIWKSIRRDLQCVNSIEIPRAYAINGIQEGDEIELHAFCDASAEAYGVVVYLLVKRNTMTWTGIVASKAKLAPKTQLSIPRLELLAAVMATRYTLYIRNNLQLKNNIKQHLWGDSRCVIAWVTANKVLPPFIDKAVKEIRAARFESFFYVPTDKNPADVVSRGADIKTLKEQHWWRGPEWLKVRDQWPKQLTYDVHYQIEENSIRQLQDEERNLLIKSTVELRKSANPSSFENSPFDMNPLNFETTGKLFRRTAVCLLAAKKLLKHRGQLKLEKELDFEQARILWLKWDQQRMYRLADKDKTNVSYLHNLKVKTDQNGLIRCITRLKWSPQPRSEAEPILLAKNTNLTRLIILSTHIQNLHAGTAHTLAAIRRTYWLPHGRRQVYQTLKGSCFRCRRYDAKPYKTPEMAPLPPFRISQTETPFNNIGVDVFGPFKNKTFIDGKMVQRKRWVILFTCLVIRAIHLEVLRDMTAEEFLRTFRKFAGRRGTPRLIVSDNAPQFKAVEGIFQCMWRRFAQAEVTTKYYAEHGIQWKFVPAHSPWMGGAYERMVRTVKNSFERVYGGEILSEDQFELAMVEVEAMVNSRPITYVDREKETEIITPNDFLCVQYPSIPINFSTTPTNSQLSASWMEGQKRLEDFWNLWSERYLKEIRERRDKVKNPKQAVDQTPRVGDVVLMVDPDQKRSAWRTAVVERLIHSADGEIRSVQIRVANRARMLRPVSKLAPLKLLMSLPEDMSEITADQQNLVVDSVPGIVEM